MTVSKVSSSTKVWLVIGAMAGILTLTHQVSKHHNTSVNTKNDEIQLANELVVTPLPMTSKSPVKSKPTSLHNTQDRTIVLNTPIMVDTANQVINKLKELDDGTSPIYLLLDSPGGSVFDGARIISQIEASKSSIYTVNVGLCASMCAIIHQYGVKRLATDRSILMFHPASGGAQGQLDNMLSLLTTLKRYIQKFNNHIIARSKMGEEEYNKRIAYEFWVDAEDAKGLNLVDSIVNLQTTDGFRVQSMGMDFKIPNSNRTEFNVKM